MKTMTLFPFLFAAHNGLCAPVPLSSNTLSDFRSHTINIVRASRQRVPLDSSIASEEVSSTLRAGEASSKTDHIDNSPLDLDGLDISAPSPIMGIERPPPASFLPFLTNSTECKDSSSSTGDPPADLNWVMALVKDVYADYRSASPCRRQDGEDSTTRIQRLVQGRVDMLVIAVVACIVMFILVLEALFTAIQRVRRIFITHHLHMSIGRHSNLLQISRTYITRLNLWKLLLRSVEAVIAHVDKTRARNVQILSSSPRDILCKKRCVVGVQGGRRSYTIR